MQSKVITTERLTIRPIEIGDINAIHAYAGDPSINMMMFLPNETLADTKAFVDYSVSQWNLENPEDREYVVVLNGQIIGGVNLEHCQDQTYEIGWTIHKDYRNHGYATEAAKALIVYAFAELKANRVQAHCDSRNTASMIVMQKSGMKLIDDQGTRYYPKTNVTSGEYLYAIDKEQN